MFALTAVMSALLALAMAGSAARKFTGATQSRQLRERLRVTPRLWQVVGLLEVVAAAGLLVGLWYAPLGIAAAGGTSLLMAGAVLAHLRVRIGGAALVPPLLVLAWSVAVTVLRVATS